MSLQDPVADMLTRIRNGQAAGRLRVAMPSSKLKVSVAVVLRDEGYVHDFEVLEEPRPTLSIRLKYHEGRPRDRFARPGEPAGAAHLPGQERSPGGHGGPRDRHRVHVARRDGGSGRPAPRGSAAKCCVR